MIFVTLAEPTPPVMEGEVLHADLTRTGITTWGGVINNFIAAAKLISAFLRQRAENEIEQIELVRNLSSRLAIVPLLFSEPIGESR